MLLSFSPSVLQVKELFKAQRDEPSRAAFLPDISKAAGSDPPTADANYATGAPSMAVTGTLKSVLRMACTVTSKV